MGIGGLWLILGVLAELGVRFSQNFELQLLPGAVRLKTWWREVLLIEPEVVGGRIGRLTDEIRLREGKQQATISLGWFANPRERAAIIEHCSQFLTVEQQASFGREWSDRYYKLLTPRKPAKSNPWHLLIAVVLTFVFGTAVLVYCCEFCVANGEAYNRAGVHMRSFYAVWFGVCLFFTGLSVRVWLVERSKKNAQLLISKIASTSTAAPVGSAANPSAERA
jgi:hypothetical protein